MFGKGLCTESSTSSNFSDLVADFAKPIDFTGEDPSKVKRDLKLYNRCSGQFVQMYSKVINARGKRHSPFGKYAITDI